MAVACSLCQGAAHTVVSEMDRHGRPLRTVVCEGCGLITNDPIPSDEELIAFYRSHYRKSYKGAELPRKRQVLRNFQRIEAHFRQNAAFYRAPKFGLDLGSGSGEFLFLAKAAGLDFIGVEPSSTYSAYTRDHLGLDVSTKVLEEIDYPPAHFDMIRLSHVLEHMRDPVRSLKTLAGWLKPDGVLYIEVPQIDAEAQRKMRGKMFHFGHIHNFDPFTLRFAASLAGLIEHPSALTRLAGTTGTFFRIGSVSEFDLAQKVRNANRNIQLMAEHNARTLPLPENGSAIGRFFKINSQRVGEQLSALRFSTHRAIADHFASRIRNL
jgi:SAM-dependent methyltransferase